MRTLLTTLLLVLAFSAWLAGPALAQAPGPADVPADAPPASRQTSEIVLGATVLLIAILLPPLLAYRRWIKRQPQSS